MRTRWMVLACVVFVLTTSVSLAEEIGYIEDFALSKDRAQALKQLIPGTEDYYYYHCLHYQNTGQWEKYDEVFRLWVARYKDTPGITEMRNRQALLLYETQPRQSLDHIIQALDLHFDHQPLIQGQKPQLPTRLDANLISVRTLTELAVARYPDTLNGMEDSALDWLVNIDLGPKRLRHFLQRLQRPDYPNLVKLIARDLEQENSRGFGYLDIHKQLLLSQLEELLKLKPELISNTHFVNAWLIRLRPADDVDWQHDPEARQEYLDRLWDFADKLPPAFNSLKTCVLYHRLLHDRELGVYDKTRFMTYIKLPRNVAYIEPRYLQAGDNRRYQANLDADFREPLVLDPVHSDHELVRSYLEHFFVEDISYQPYAAFIRDTWLKPVFAETKLTQGIGDPEQWYSLLTPEAVQQLKDRVDLDFACTNKTMFQPDEPVKLALWIKNVDKLMVKVYEVNTLNYYLEQDKPVDLDINLDGLVANAEEVYTYSEPPLRRVSREFPFDRLKSRGVYVVEFIGNGQRSRALIRKGELRFLEESTTAGHVFRILDEKNTLLKDATLWMGGAEYKPDKDGVILVPFSTSPRSQSILLKQGDFTTLARFNHQAEEYRFQAGFWVDREQLLSRRQATLLVRPSLSVHGQPVTLSVLEDIKLLIISTDLDGVATTKEVPDFKLSEGIETAYPFRVPERLASIRFVLSAQVRNLSTDKKLPLGDEMTLNLNGIDYTACVEDLHLLRSSGSYILEVLGRTGEPRADRPVTFVFKHRDFKDPVTVALQTDNEGRIALGNLSDIVSVSVVGPETTQHTWTLSQDVHSNPGSLHGRVGDTLYVPYMGSAKEPLRSELSLLEMRGSTFVADRFSALAIKDGFIQISDLARGDYDLLMKSSNTRIRLRVSEGTLDLGYVLGETRQLEVINPKPLQITSVLADKDNLTIRLANANAWTRVHVAVDRYLPEFPIEGLLGRTGFADPTLIGIDQPESRYVAGVAIGDEYRYILERKYAKKFAGNMLERPSLLLNPWDLAETRTGKEWLGEGGPWGAARGLSGELSAKNWGGRIKNLQAGKITPDLDFLARASVVLVNLKPDEKGVITIKRADLGDRQDIYIFAADPLNSVYRSFTLPEPKDVQFLDLRLAENLDPAKHFTEQKQVTVAPAGKPFTIADLTTSKMETYDTLAKVYRLYATLSEDETLGEFSFILDWPTFDRAKKLELYSKYACHELHFFLYRKDPDFFNEVVKPYLANKKDKTFLDRWFLGENLSTYLTPWNFEQLNLVERVLLGRVVKDEPARVARHVKDLYDLIPPDVESLNLLFQTALKGSALEVAPDAGRPAEADKEKNLEQARFSRGGRAGLWAATGGATGASEAAMESPAAPADAPAPTPKKSEMKATAERLDKDADGAYFSEDRKRTEGRRLYLEIDKTKELVENNYYHLPIADAGADLVPVNAFWKDYAAHDPGTPFFSTHLTEACTNFTEIMFALSVLDLPFKAGEHKSESASRSWTLTPASPAIIFHQEIKEAKPLAERLPILVSQNFFRQDDRYRFVDNERTDKYVTEEFLTHVVYGCQVVLTNPTSAPQKLDLLIQVPRGAVPVLKSHYTRGVHVDLAPYNTTTLEYAFYFPAPGQYVHFPVHVARNEQLAVSAQPFSFKVVVEPSVIDKESWDWVSQSGTEKQVFDYLDTHNLERTDLDRIAWRMKNADFFRKVTGLLKTRHVYNNTLWSYALKLNLLPEASEFLSHAEAFIDGCGDGISSRLLTIDPVVRKSYQHMEYDPLVNARAHKLGPQWSILNNQFHQQYTHLLRVLSCRPALDNDDLMAVTYYLLLQDRVEDALTFFQRVDPAKLETRLQYDYFQVYLDFSTLNLADVRKVATPYASYPVERWRKRFQNVLAQLDEAEGKAPAVADTTRPDQAQLAASQPAFDFTVEARNVTLNYQNLTRVTVNYYLMDVELLFSQNPFPDPAGVSGRFAWIRPNHSQVLDLDPGKKSVAFELPEAFRSANVAVEVVGAGLRKSQTYYANTLAVQLIENYGQLRVTDQASGKPLPKTYVKVYARMTNGKVLFYKDGYTDLRGRFDYASVSGTPMDAVEKFSILLMSEEQGAVVREADPPKR